jgi:predicted acylesterase/phospholipase RssA
MFGAYSAGVLKGWTESGTRPQFDVVTGVSTGALIAPYAFLGPQYDAKLERLYTSMRRESIFRIRLLLLDSIVSSEPLEQQIAARTTPELLRRIAEAHRQGRRLYVGTTSLDTKRLVVWDMGAIAARNSVESTTLFQKVLLASCSVPGLLPPVPIDVEIDGKRFTALHVDGSVTACIFLKPAMVGIGPDGVLSPSARSLSIRVVVAGKVHQTVAPTKRDLFS